jgi:hypothetical protein
METVDKFVRALHIAICMGFTAVPLSQVFELCKIIAKICGLVDRDAAISPATKKIISEHTQFSFHCSKSYSIPLILVASCKVEFLKFVDKIHFPVNALLDIVEN